MKSYRLLLVASLVILTGCNDQDYTLKEPFRTSNGLYGYKDADGKIRIKPKYEDAYSFHEGLASVSKNGKRGYVDMKDNEVIPFTFDYAYSFRNGLAWVQADGKPGMIDKNGNWLSDAQLPAELGSWWNFR